MTLCDCVEYSALQICLETSQHVCSVSDDLHGVGINNADTLHAHTVMGRSLAEAHFKPPNYVDLFDPWALRSMTMTLIHSIYTCQKVKERFHLYDPVQHDGKDDGDNPREEIADDRGDSSIVTSKLGHHLENIQCQSRCKEQERPPDRNSVWEMAMLQPERYWCSSR